MLYKIRLECTSFRDIVVRAKSQKEARNIAMNSRPNCSDQGFEFGEFLFLEDDDVENVIN